MDGQSLAEWAVVVFALSVLAWVIYRLTWLVTVLAADKKDEPGPEG